MRVAIIAAVLLLSACTTGTQVSSRHDRALDAMIGEPVTVAIAQLGEPIGIAKMGTRLVYGWGHTFTSSEFSNAAPGWVEAADFHGGVFPTPRRTVHSSCVIRMIVGADALIQDWDYQDVGTDCRSSPDIRGDRRMAQAG